MDLPTHNFSSWYTVHSVDLYVLVFLSISMKDGVFYREKGCFMDAFAYLVPENLLPTEERLRQRQEGSKERSGDEKGGG